MSRTAGGQTTYFLYAGDQLQGEVDSNGNLLRSYSWGETGLISDREGSQSRFYESDGLGSTRALLGVDGSVIAEAIQSALGDWQAPVALVQGITPFGWQGVSGTYQDSATGLMSGSNGGRPYQPNLGQFVSPASAGMSGGAPYSYGNGDPVNDEALEGVDEDGRPLPYQSVRSGLHHGAGQAAALLNTLADFNPLCQTFSIVQGSDARGCQLRPGERLVRLLAMALPYTRIPRINFLRGTRLRIGAGRLNSVVNMALPITQRFENGQCMECANALRSAFRRAGVRGEQIEIRGASDFIVSDTFGYEAISRNGRHMGIIVQGRVFDNIHKGGIPLNDWLNDFHSFGGITVHERIPF